MHLKQYNIDPNRCTQCYRCLAVCPEGAIKVITSGTPQIDYLKCTRCGACKKICRQQAVSHRVRLQF